MKPRPTTADRLHRPLHPAQPPPLRLPVVPHAASGPMIVHPYNPRAQSVKGTFGHERLRVPTNPP